MYEQIASVLRNDFAFLGIDPDEAFEQGDEVLGGATEDITVVYSPRDTFLVRLTGTNNNLAKGYDDGVMLSSRYSNDGDTYRSTNATHADSSSSRPNSTGFLRPSASESVFLRPNSTTACAEWADGLENGEKLPCSMGGLQSKPKKQATKASSQSPTLVKNSIFIGRKSNSPENREQGLQKAQIKSRKPYNYMVVNLKIRPRWINRKSSLKMETNPKDASNETVQPPLKQKVPFLPLLAR